MNDSSRRRILARIRSNLKSAPPVDPPSAAAPAPERTPAARMEYLRQRMTAVHAEVHMVEKPHWTETFKAIAADKNWREIACGSGHPLIDELKTAWQTDANDLPVLTPYTALSAPFKARLFQVDAGITSTMGAVADTGALIVWPTPAEPRLLSLVPPVHVALLPAEHIYNSLAEAMTEQKWKAGMPSNALLISGPSKTADIEFKLVYGVHGPHELMVLMLV